MSKATKGPEFVKYFVPLLNALKELGYSGTPTEVKNLIIETLQISEELLEEKLKSGSSRVINQIDWARFYLVKAGYLDASKRGVWTLTEKGIVETVNNQKAFAIFKEVQGGFKDKKSGNSTTIDGDIQEEISAPDSDTSLITVDYREKLLQILRNLSPNGFEHLCKQFLREAGFQEVEVTGKTGDGGIDGKGILQINPLLSIPVLFQCKRYTGSVGAPQIRDFRGAMMGRADKDILITTGSFTKEAEREAIRDGVSPIELVDSNKLIKMFEQLELGLKPKTVYEIDTDFFDRFR
ncbi:MULTISPECIES: restriction endonuclease [unclassified Synechocystis]|uniref:restriction endonuclease n=1 Tax=unclassified Synechocystis TaxID=2640012 RepID=UPI0004082487|nr:MULTISPECIES: restriction endonuclease [unclassified Synechocystis]AIE75625.1 Mrr restriction system protein [Synechocystis sp. PCC 6714]MCT0253817.1 restriction endonuclease [Synechocystis sp. CS-94]